jgi:hypothetical protein
MFIMSMSEEYNKMKDNNTAIYKPAPKHKGHCFNLTFPSR